MNTETVPSFPSRVVLNKNIDRYFTYNMIKIVGLMSHDYPGYEANPKMRSMPRRRPNQGLGLYVGGAAMRRRTFFVIISLPIFEGRTLFRRGCKQKRVHFAAGENLLGYENILRMFFASGVSACGTVFRDTPHINACYSSTNIIGG